MSELLQKLNDYFGIIGYTIRYELENGAVIEYKFQKTNFLRMIGLHKLIDILLISRFNDSKDTKISAKYAMQQIKKGVLSNEDIQKSTYFCHISERYYRFTADNLLTLSYTDAIVDFDYKLLQISKYQIHII